MISQILIFGSNPPLTVKDAISDWSVAKYFKLTCCFCIFMALKIRCHTIRFICSFQTTHNNPISGEGRIPQLMSNGMSDYPNSDYQSALTLLSISFRSTISWFLLKFDARLMPQLIIGPSSWLSGLERRHRGCVMRSVSCSTSTRYF